MHDIKVNGVINALRVHREGDKFRLVNGQSRLNAAIRAGLTEVPVSIMEGPITESRLLIEEVIGNNFQQGFGALALAEIAAELQALNKWSDAELCRNVPAISPATLSRSKAMWRDLIAELQAKVKDGELGVRKAYAISRKPAGEQMAAFRRTEHMDAKSAEDHLNEDKKPAPKQERVKLSLPGMQLILTVVEVAKARALWDQVNAGLKKVEQHGIPLDNLPGLVKQ